MSKNPFIRVDWEDYPENITQERVKRMKAYFQKKYNSTDVKIIVKTLSNSSNTKLKSLDVSDNILDPQYQKTLIKEFMDENKIGIKWELIDRLDNKVNGEIDKANQEKVRYNKWYLEKVEFSNFISYGDNNTIDFTDLDGITAVESFPKNFGGKTTATVDLLMFLFFNSTTKTSVNIDVFNQYRNVDTVWVKGYVTIDGEKYIIERTVTRKLSKAGEYSAKSDLEFSKVNSDGTVENLSGEQRRITEKFITSAIGTEEDFLATILTTGKNLEELIDSKPTARGAILTRFLGLENLKQKEEICKNIQSEWSKKLVSNTYNVVTLETTNEANKTLIDEHNGTIIKLGNDLLGFEANLLQIEKRRDDVMLTRNNDIDQDLIKTNPVLVQREIDDLKSLQTKSREGGLLVSVTEPSQYYSEEDHDKIKSEINDLNIEIRMSDNTITRNEVLVSQMEKGDVCPTCKRPFTEVDHTEEIKNLKDLVTKLKMDHLEITLKLPPLTEKEKVFITIKKEFDENERNKLRKATFE